jgi:hypothetical protein
MLLCDATGYVDNGRHKRIEDAIQEVFEADGRGDLLINKSVGNGSVYTVEQFLRQAFPHEMVWFKIQPMVPGDLIDLEAKIMNSDFLVIDDAHALDRDPQMAELLTRMKGETRMIYIATISMSPERYEAEGLILDALDAQRAS